MIDFVAVTPRRAIARLVAVKASIVRASQ